jgi:hypothetical protein
MLFKRFKNIPTPLPNNTLSASLFTHFGHYVLTEAALTGIYRRQLYAKAKTGSLPSLAARYYVYPGAVL